MTLTLEQVRQTRFHLARRNGYEPVDVDNFVDKVEVTLAQLGEENETLVKQVEALTAGGDMTLSAGDGGAEADELRQLLADANAEVERLGGELDGRSQELSHLRSELESARAALTEGEQGELIAQLQGQLDQARADLAGRDGQIAALQAELDATHQELDGVRIELAAAQAANAERTSKIEHIQVTAAADAAPAVTKLLQMATEQAERLVGESEEDARRITAEASANAAATLEEAAAQAHEALTSARERADEMEQQARSAAEALDAESLAKAEAFDAELADRRIELFHALEVERDELRDKVDHLRSFEDRYRNSLSSQLRAQLESLAGNVEPADTPALLSDEDEPAGPSETPRLDALLNEQN
ncbi:MAG: DivIVA domain-containing protein [Micropruina sp.]|uniref:DivIVA domain-containing protein n=1 Tax=Micropruina sp. TaxID=2737536 RepID=UPI0039E5CD79